MSVKHSTAALTKEAHAKQDARYAEGHEYDYLIIGTGNSALTAAALLANAGNRVCMLEAHDIPGGYAHTFKMGDFYFCAQVHYIWGCGPGEKIYEFLKHIGLEKDITFELFDPEGYDHMVMPDGTRVKIPYGFDKLAKNIEQVYPDQSGPVKNFLGILSKIFREMRSFPTGKIHWWKFIPVALRVPNLIRYRNSTLQDVFDQCGLSNEVQAVFAANAGDMGAPPQRLSIFVYAAVLSGYDKGAYYPTKHYKYYIDRLAKFITDHKGCHIYYETEVTKINIDDEKVTSVETKNGKTFKAKNYICNMDPQKASYMIGREKFPKSYLKKLDYEYSPSGVMVYLGLKDIDLRDYGFGNFNIWHLEQWDMNKMFDEQAQGNFQKPWLFMSTPTLHTDVGGVAPEGMQILEFGSYFEYASFKTSREKSEKEYTQLKLKIANRLLDIIEEKYIPDLRKHIYLQVLGSPMTNEDFCMATKGNAYGSIMTPENIGIKRLKAYTPWKNFFWCNASSGYASMHGTVATGVSLYQKLTGDYFSNAMSKKK